MAYWNNYRYAILGIGIGLVAFTIARMRQALHRLSSSLLSFVFSGFSSWFDWPLSRSSSIPVGILSQRCRTDVIIFKMRGKLDCNVWVCHQSSLLLTVKLSQGPVAQTPVKSRSILMPIINRNPERVEWVELISLLGLFLLKFIRVCCNRIPYTCACLYL